MAIKHEAVVTRGDLLTSNMWNAAHIIEDMTIKGIHIDNLQIGTDHLINDSVTTAKLAIQDYLDLVNRLTDPTLAKGRLWFREDLVKLRFSPDGTTVKEIAWVGDISDHAAITPIDHPDLSVTTAKIADAAIVAAKIADAAVTTAKIADAAVTPLKLSFGTLEKIVEDEVTAAEGDQTTLTYTGLDLDAAKAYLMLLMFTNPTTSTAEYSLFYNNDTVAANYYNQALWASGTTIYASRANNAHISGAVAGQQANVTLWIFRDPAGYVRAIPFENLREPASIVLRIRSHIWVTTANVTRIDIMATVAGAIGVGSKVLIFRVSA